MARKLNDTVEKSVWPVQSDPEPYKPPVYTDGDFIRWATNPELWLAYTRPDQWNQVSSHIIQAPTAPAARRILRAAVHDSDQYKLKKITDMISDLKYSLAKAP